MSKINWKVRLAKKSFWVAIVPAVLLLAQQILKIFGVDFDYSQISSELIAVIGTVFVVLSILGIVIDPTTKGIGESEQALTYTEPK